MIQKDANLYNLTQSLAGSIFFAGFKTHLTDEQRADWQNRPALMSLKGGYAESPAWVMVQTLEFDPTPLSVERFRKRAVYSSPSLTQALLEVLASEGYLDPIGDDYHLTDKGHEHNQKSQAFRYNVTNGFEPVDTDKIIRLEALLQRVVDASLHSETPPGTWCIDYSRNRAPDENDPVLAKVIQYGSDFNSFRDDAHMAAFGAHNVLGHMWEAFSYVKSEQAQDVATLYEKLAYRGFYSQDWQAALDDLSVRGWIVENGGQYTVTDSGNTIAEDIESQTNAYFYAPWDVLSDDEFEEVTGLMQEMIEACQALTAQ